MRARAISRRHARDGRGREGREGIAHIPHMCVCVMSEPGKRGDGTVEVGGKGIAAGASEAMKVVPVVVEEMGGRERCGLGQGWEFGASGGVREGESMAAGAERGEVGGRRSRDVEDVVHMRVRSVCGRRERAACGVVVVGIGLVGIVRGGRVG